MPRIKTKFLPLLILALFVLTGSEIWAFYEAIGAKSIGMGGGFRALADDNSAIFFNPAGITQSRKYCIGAGYTYLDTGSDGYNYFSGSIVDSRTGPIGAGIAYLYREKDQRILTNDAQEVAVGISQEYLKSFHLGFTTHYLWSDPQGWRLDASFLLIPTPYIIFGVVGKNLYGIKGDAREVDFALGSRIGNYVNLDFDLLWLPKVEGHNLGYNAGIELVARNEFFFRGGYSFDRFNRDWYGIGIGWHYPRGAIDYGFKREVGSSDLIGHWVEISVSI